MGILSRIRRRLDQMDMTYRRLVRLDHKVERLREAVGKMESSRISSSSPTCIQDSEFRVFSQWGEDGILQFLIRRITVQNPVFVEFGVENYLESNTRFLLINNGWSGLIMDGSRSNVEFVRNDPIYWRHNLKAVHAFVTRENISSLLAENGIRGEIGLLSVDIDGNDYWIWDAITGVDPAIVVVEYNSLFGPERAVTVPYDPEFTREKAHYTLCYYGASLAALVALGNRRGYAFVGTNSAGNNAFFVRRSLMTSSLKELSAAEGYVPRRFREARDKTGALRYTSHDEDAREIGGLPVENVSSSSEKLFPTANG